MLNNCDTVLDDARLIILDKNEEADLKLKYF